MSFSPDGEIIASASGDTTVKLWRIDGTLLKTLTGHSGKVNEVHFSPNGKIIASASDDTTLKLWTREGTFIRTLEEHSSGVFGISFTPNGQIITSASWDGTVKLWTLDGTLITTLESDSPVTGVSFSSDGKILASANDNGTIKLWDLNPDNLVALGCYWLKDYFITHPELKQELYICQDKEVVKAIPLLLRNQAQELAKIGTINQALALFTEAQKLDYSLKFDIQKDVYQPAALYWLQQGRYTASEGDSKLALFFLKKALKIDSRLKINLQAELTIGNAIYSLKQGNIETAIQDFEKTIILDSSLYVPAYQWGRLCWDGSLNGYAKEVLFACENAVKLAPNDGDIKDSRGLARALTGDVQGAIEDFQAFVEWTNDDERKAQRQAWIDALKAGKNPFTPEVLEKLKNS